MNDLERRRAMREASQWDEREKLVRATSERLIEHLPVGMVWSDRFTAMMLAVLGCADTLGIDRADVMMAFSKLANETRPLEIAGLKELLGDV